MKAFIFAAGLGTRLKPLTDTKPKALVEVGEKPLIDYLLDKLLALGCEDFVINIHHFGQQIVEHIAKRGLNSMVKFSDESDQLRETGGAIKHAAEFLRDGEPFLVHNADVVSNVDVLAMYDAFSQDDLALLLVSERETSRYLLFDKDDRLVGWTNKLTGEVKTPYVDLDIDKCRYLAFAGVHIISPRILSLMESCGEKFSIIDFYLSVADKYKIRAYQQQSLSMVDVGKFDQLDAATKAIKQIIS